MCGPDVEPPTRPYRTQLSLTPASATFGTQTQDDDLIIESFPLLYEGHVYPHSRICYLRGRPPVPVVLVHANYAGLKQFDVDVAAFLARAGYVGLAVDLYKDTIDYTFEDRNPRTVSFRKMSSDQRERVIRRHRAGSDAAMDSLLRNPRYWRGLLGAYLEAASRHPAVASGLAGAIGYCLGGQCVLEHVRAGHQLQAVVSFHGVMHSRPRHRKEDRRLTAEEYEQEVLTATNTYNASCKVLIEHGDHDIRDGRDPKSIAAWKAEMDAAGIDWRFNIHARTPHGFALAPGLWSSAYVEAADRRSTLDMLSLFAEVWPQFQQQDVAINACGTKLRQRIQSWGAVARL